MLSKRGEGKIGKCRYHEKGADSPFPGEVAGSKTWMKLRVVAGKAGKAGKPMQNLPFWVEFGWIFMSFLAVFG